MSTADHSETPRGAAEQETLGFPGSTTISVDDAGVNVLVLALDLYQRVCMGQWREVASLAYEVLGDNTGPFSEAADALMEVRCRFTAVPELTHPNASLGIMRAGEQARIACDLWHALGGGMESRQNDRLSSTSVSVSSWKHNHPWQRMMTIQREGKCPECDRTGQAETEDAYF